MSQVTKGKQFKHRGGMWRYVLARMHTKGCGQRLQSGFYQNNIFSNTVQLLIFIVPNFFLQHYLHCLTKKLDRTLRRNLTRRKI